MTIHTKVAVYRALPFPIYTTVCCAWTLYSTQEKGLKAIHLRNLRHILAIKWSDRVMNIEVISRSGLQRLHGHPPPTAQTRHG